MNDNKGESAISLINAAGAGVGAGIGKAVGSMNIPRYGIILSKFPLSALSTTISFTAIAGAKSEEECRCEIYKTTISTAGAAGLGAFCGLFSGPFAPILVGFCAALGSYFGEKIASNSCDFVNDIYKSIIEFENPSAFFSIFDW